MKLWRLQRKTALIALFSITRVCVCVCVFFVCCSVRFAASELFLVEATTVAFGTCWAMAVHFPSFRALQSNPMCDFVADLTTATGGAASSFLSTY
jgi:hypothetical protein